MSEMAMVRQRHIRDGIWEFTTQPSDHSTFPITGRGRNDPVRRRVAGAQPLYNTFLFQPGQPVVFFPAMNFTLLDWSAIILYLGITLALGLYFRSRSGMSVDDYFVSG